MTAEIESLINDAYSYAEEMLKRAREDRGDLAPDAPREWGEALTALISTLADAKRGIENAQFLLRRRLAE